MNRNYYDRKLAKHSAGLPVVALFGLVLLLAVILHGCTHRQARNVALAGIAADVIATNDALSRGCTEANPVYGDDMRQVVAINAALAVGVWYLSAWMEANEAPHWPLTLAGILRGSAAVHNLGIDCK